VESGRSPVLCRENCRLRHRYADLLECAMHVRLVLPISSFARRAEEPVPLALEPCGKFCNLSAVVPEVWRHEGTGEEPSDRLVEHCTWVVADGKCAVSRCKFLCECQLLDVRL